MWTGSHATPRSSGAAPGLAPEQPKEETAEEQARIIEPTAKLDEDNEYKAAPLTYAIEAIEVGGSGQTMGGK